MSTFGPAYEEKIDGERIYQQHIIIRDWMLKRNWQTLAEISELGYPEASISAQLRHLRKKRFGSYVVEKRRRQTSGGGTWEYRVRPPVK